MRTHKHRRSRINTSTYKHLGRSYPTSGWIRSQGTKTPGVKHDRPFHRRKNDFFPVRVRKPAEITDWPTVSRRFSPFGIAQRNPAENPTDPDILVETHIHTIVFFSCWSVDRCTTKWFLRDSPNICFTFELYVLGAASSIFWLLVISSIGPPFPHFSFPSRGIIPF